MAEFETPMMSESLSPRLVYMPPSAMKYNGVPKLLLVCPPYGHTSTKSDRTRQGRFSKDVTHGAKRTKILSIPLFRAIPKSTLPS
ncbi:hypothetical protein VTK56DRAFT_6050 [Thermocarpiscus australiensis]